MWLCVYKVLLKGQTLQAKCDASAELTKIEIPPPNPLGLGTRKEPIDSQVKNSKLTGEIDMFTTWLKKNVLGLITQILL